MSKKQLKKHTEFGELLRRAREALSLSQKQIAVQLNLKEKIVAALDTGDFDNLPASIYVKGYIRSYARAVNLDADTLIEIYENMDNSSDRDDQPEIVPDVKPATPSHQRESPFKVVTHFVMFVFAIVLIAWWQSPNVVGVVPAPEAPRASMGGTYAGGFTYTYPAISHANTFVATSDADVDTPDITNTPKIMDDSDGAELSVAPTNRGVLEMTLTAESWVEIYDRHGEQQYLGLGADGETIRVIAETPLSVTLGNATAVSVGFNGKAFDTTDYTQGAVARFVLE